MISSRQRAMSKTTRPTTKVLRERQNHENKSDVAVTTMCNKRKAPPQTKSSRGDDAESTVYKRPRQTDEQIDSINYRIGDWVYCEVDTDQPYQIRRIEEFNKRPDGSYEARVRCAFRRGDIAPSLLANLEKRFSQHFTSIQSTLSFSSIKSDEPLSSNITTQDDQDENDDSDEETRKYNKRTIQFIQSLKPLQIYQLKHRELFYSRYYESNVPVSCFRGKLTLDLFMPEVNWFGDYLANSMDRFFYQICYDPNKNMISDDKMLIRVGPKFQADIPDRVSATDDDDNNRETLVWSGPSCQASMGEICLNKYLKKVVETKLKLNETFQDCELTETRDIIKYNAMRLLHNYNYDRNKALSTFDCNLFKMSSDEKRLTASSINENIGSKVWTKREMKYFETGVYQFGKDFNQIRKIFLPNKPLTSIIEYYYNVYKITDDYIRKRDEKRVTKQERLVEVKGRKYTLVDVDEERESDETTGAGAGTAASVCVSCQKAAINNQNWLIANQSYSQPVIKMVNQHQQRGIMSDVVAILDPASTQFKLIDKPSPASQNDLILDYKSKETNTTAAKLCQSCWVYWKKYGSFKYNYPESQRNQMNSERMCPEKRRNKNQVYVCNIDDCGREFTKKSEFCHHSTYTHCLLVKSIITQPPGYKQLNGFCLKTSAATKSAREKLEPGLLMRLARNPCQLSLDYKSLTLRGDKRKATKRAYVRKATTTTPIVIPKPAAETEPEVKVVVRKRGRPRKNQLVEEKPSAVQEFQYSCQVDKCGQQFKKKKELSQHTTLTHALIVKNINAAEPRVYHDLKYFSLHTTPVTRVARVVCTRSRFARKLARNPFKQTLDMNKLKKLASGNQTTIKTRLEQMRRRESERSTHRVLRSRNMVENNNSPPSSKSSNASSSPHASLTNIVNRLETPPSKKSKSSSGVAGIKATSKENTNNISVNLSPSSISSSSRSSISSSRRGELSYNVRSSHTTASPRLKSDIKIIDLGPGLDGTLSSGVKKGFEYSSDQDDELWQDEPWSSDGGCDENYMVSWNGPSPQDNIYLKNLKEINARINGTNSVVASCPAKTHDWYFKSNKDIKNTRISMIESRELKKMAMRPVNRSNSKLYDAICSKTTLAAADAKVRLKQALVKCLELQSRLDEHSSKWK